MPSGAKKRKALKKKKKQQEGIGTSTNNTKDSNGDNLHRHDEHGSQDERESDSTLSSPGSQGNEELSTKNPSAALSSGALKGSTKEISRDVDVTQGLGPKSGNAIAFERGMDDKKSFVEKARNSSSDNRTHTSKNVACQDCCDDSIVEISPALDSVKPVVSISKAVISERNEDAETSTHTNFLKQKSNGNEEYPSPGLEKDNSKVVTLPRSAAEASEKVDSVREYEIPVSTEEKHLLLPGPPVIRRTSWLSCCGLFDAMTGSDR